MSWSEIKRWAKDCGFDAVKQKDNSVNGASYYWHKIDDPNIRGVSQSVSKLATDIFNTITNNIWLAYQQEYKLKQDKKEYFVQ